MLPWLSCARVLSGIAPCGQELAGARSHGHGRGGSGQTHSQVHPKAPFPSRLLITSVAKTGHKNEISPQTRTYPQFCKERGLFTERGKELGSLAISMVYHEDRGGMVLTVNPGM